MASGPSTEVLRLTFNTDKAIKQLGGIITRGEKALFRAGVKETMVAVSASVRRRVDADIARAGNFSGRWQTAFVIQNAFSGVNAIMRTGFSHAIPYGHVHEFGATIKGQPLLWIPLRWNPNKVRAREYPGKLFRVERPGKNPLLFSSTGAQYVGVRQVILRPRFHIRSIVANVARTELAKFFRKTVSQARLK